MPTHFYKIRTSLCTGDLNNVKMMKTVNEAKQEGLPMKWTDQLLNGTIVLNQKLLP
ncbi:hypothetical protein PACILC2_04280 [Paenibacillus cisolokensis]|uniref:Uncharacterized protein n=1 Tax=Paenibacillus cisolokensis TaxID=1658519 RepID=A0ABQ4N125_9BACL|nr:hypothetical protein PACILC2_04280 [Paenibacillus cisolokensis]